MLFYIAGPILLLLFGSLDLTQSIVAGDEKRRKALMTNFVKRCIENETTFLSLLGNTEQFSAYGKLWIFTDEW